MEYVNIGRVRPIYKGEHNQELNYEALDVVRSKDGFTSYMAKKAVPAGKALTDEEYWGLMNEVKSDVVQYGSAQTLTGEQQDQARANIGAASDMDVIELKGDLDKVVKKFPSINGIKKDEVSYNGWNVLLPVYLEKDITYVFGWAFSNSESLTSPGVSLQILNNISDRTVLRTIKSDYGQISPNGHDFTSELESGWYILSVNPTAEPTENTFKYIMCVKESYLIENNYTWVTIQYMDYALIVKTVCEESSNSFIADKVKSRYYGKVHLSYGDSITEQSVWQSMFKEYLGTANEIIKGYSGHALWAHCTLNEITYNIGSETFDFATVMFGTNDWGQSRQIGVNTDYNDNGEFTGTYKGSLNTFCKNITTLFPDKPIIMVTPPNGFEDYDYNGEAFTENGSKNLLGFTIKDYAEAMKEICALWGIPCFDFNSVCGWNYINKATYLTNDGNGIFIHPNSVGGNEYAYKLAKFCEMN